VLPSVGRVNLVPVCTNGGTRRGEKESVCSERVDDGKVGGGGAAGISLM